jgi:hypothetical protein
MSTWHNNSKMNWKTRRRKAEELRAEELKPFDLNDAGALQRKQIVYMNDRDIATAKLQRIKDRYAHIDREWEKQYNRRMGKSNLHMKK